MKLITSIANLSRVTKSARVAASEYASAITYSKKGLVYGEGFYLFILSPALFRSSNSMTGWNSTFAPIIKSGSASTAI